MIVVLMKCIIGLDKENANTLGSAKEPGLVMVAIIMKQMDGAQEMLFAHF